MCVCVCVCVCPPSQATIGYSCLLLKPPCSLDEPGFSARHHGDMTLRSGDDGGLDSVKLNVFGLKGTFLGTFCPQFAAH